MRATSRFLVNKFCTSNFARNPSLLETGDEFSDVYYDN